jgi:vitamin B12 transporter
MLLIVNIARGAALAAALLLAGPAVAQEAAETPEFVVVNGDTLWLAEVMDVRGTRVTAALPAVVRQVSALDEDELRRLPGRSAAEALQTVPAVVASQRQQYGVQSDLSVRGSTFEQVQVLLDGYDVGDPQTGHHLMDLPVGGHDIQRLEVLPGHGSVLYGMGAFGGTVNVVTRQPALPDTAGHPLVTDAEAALYGGAGGRSQGSSGSWGGWAGADLALGQQTGLRLSGEGFRTDGYDVQQSDGGTAWGGNDADVFSTTGRLVHRFDRGEANLQAGYSDRQFGAQDFYAPFMSYEKTRTFFTAASYKRAVSERLTVEPRVYFRRHRDEFILLRDDPGYYTNDHLTRKTGADLRGLVNLGRGQSLALSAELGYEDIDSRGLRRGVWGEALGSHLRRRASAAAEWDGHAGKWRWQLGSRLDRRTGYKARLAGSGAVAYAVSDDLLLRTSAGSVYRVPTFTELYYGTNDQNPTSLGDPRLQAERGWTWDVGAEHYRGPWNARASYFERHERGTIEWARPIAEAEADPATTWQAMNIGEGTVKGAEVAAGWRSGAGHALGASYVVLDKTTDLPAELEGKYALLTPEHQVVLQGTLVLQPELSATVLGRYLEHSEGPDDFRQFFVLDGRLDWRHPGGWFLAISGTNLLDRRYEEVPGVQMPGVMYMTTVGWGF